jgi:hypothetical protein
MGWAVRSERETRDTPLVLCWRRGAPRRVHRTRGSRRNRRKAPRGMALSGVAVELGDRSRVRPRAHARHAAATGRDGGVYRAAVECHAQLSTRRARERRERITAVGHPSVRHWHRTKVGCRGFTGPVPQPLSMSALGGIPTAADHEVKCPLRLDRPRAGESCTHTSP